MQDLVTTGRHRKALGCGRGEIGGTRIDANLHIDTKTYLDIIVEMIVRLIYGS